MTCWRLKRPQNDINGLSAVPDAERPEVIDVLGITEEK
jgi:hypothetical protein